MRGDLYDRLKATADTYEGIDPEIAGLLREAASGLRALAGERDEAKGMREQAALLLWARFASSHHGTWEDEPHKAEYRSAAAAVLGLVGADDVQS